MTDLAAKRASNGDRPNGRVPLRTGNAERFIEPGDFHADSNAFVDVRLPRSAGKASYSFIGPGVSQNADQPINLVEPHGFNIGAASMPHGVVNNPHLHFTAEVFICTRGEFTMQIGETGDQELTVQSGDVFSVPTWIFRGFENVGADDGWLFTVLGGDETGGIIWAPHVLEAAAETGLHLAADWSVVDSPVPPADAVAPFTPEQLASLDRYSDAELAESRVDAGSLAWSDRALLSSVLDGHGTRIAPVIGHGISEQRGQVAPIIRPHGFSIEWLELDAHATTGLFAIADTQVVFCIDGDVEVGFDHELGDDSGAEIDTPPVLADDCVACPPADTIVSIPTGAWRSLRNTADTPRRVLLVSGGDHPNVATWHPTVVEAAQRAGLSRDASGYLAPAELLSRRPKDES